MPAALLIATPGLLNTKRIESRTELDSSGFDFTVMNATTAPVKLTNIQLTLAFDFSGKNLTINDKPSSAPGSPGAVVIEVDDLLPGGSKTVNLNLVANVGGHPSPTGKYPFAVLATYETEPWPAILEPTEIGGGAQVFVVVPD